MYIPSHEPEISLRPLVSQKVSTKTWGIPKGPNWGPPKKGPKEGLSKRLCPPAYFKIKPRPPLIRNNGGTLRKLRSNIAQLRQQTRPLKEAKRDDR